MRKREAGSGDDGTWHLDWMYVYLAVDVYTYDLLHVDIYPDNGKAEARTFLQALKAKGYQPQVIITDMNQDYTGPMRHVFPKAEHHECVFHALQWAQRRIKEVYGPDYAETHPEAEKLKQRLYKLEAARARCRSRRTQMRCSGRAATRWRASPDRRAGPDGPSGWRDPARDSC